MLICACTPSLVPDFVPIVDVKCESHHRCSFDRLAVFRLDFPLNRRFGNEFEDNRVCLRTHRHEGRTGSFARGFTFRKKSRLLDGYTGLPWWKPVEFEMAAIISQAGLPGSHVDLNQCPPDRFTCEHIHHCAAERVLGLRLSR